MHTWMCSLLGGGAACAHRDVQSTRGGAACAHVDVQSTRGRGCMCTQGCAVY